MLLTLTRHTSTKKHQTRRNGQTIPRRVNFAENRIDRGIAILLDKGVANNGIRRWVRKTFNLRLTEYQISYRVAKARALGVRRTNWRNLEGDSLSIIRHIHRAATPTAIRRLVRS